MTRFGPIFRLALLCILFATANCTRRPLCYYEGELVPISVKIDWTNSNIPVTETDPTGGDLVHRVSFRFYPTDGAEPFERYLEGNIFEGTINVPTGVYRASGLTMQSTSTYLNALSSLVFVSDTDGTASRTFLSFGRTPVPGEEHYEIELDALLVNGSLYNADGGLTYDVTDQVAASDGLDITIKLPEAHSDMPIELPQTEGGITVDPWDDDEITLN